MILLRERFVFIAVFASLLSCCGNCLSEDRSAIAKLIQDRLSLETGGAGAPYPHLIAATLTPSFLPASALADIPEIRDTVSQFKSYSYSDNATAKRARHLAVLFLVGDHFPESCLFENSKFILRSGEPPLAEENITGVSFSVRTVSDLESPIAVICSPLNDAVIYKLTNNGRSFGWQPSLDKKIETRSDNDGE